MTTEIKLPELGENIESAEVLSVLVSAGDTVKKDQPLIELETDKATAEVPSEVAGVVKDVLVRKGEEIKVGQIIVVLEAEGATASESSPAQDAPPARKPEPTTPAASTAPAPEPEDASSEETASPPQPDTTPPVEAAPPVPEPESVASEKAAPPRKPEPITPPAGLDARHPVIGAIGDVAPAAPSVRRLARELGIDVESVPGSGPGGRISEADVRNHARELISGADVQAKPLDLPRAGGGIEIPELPDFTQWGEVEREPASKVRRITAQTLSLSWAQIPHVTQFDRADITELEDWRKRYAEKVVKVGGKLTVTAIAVKAVAGALKVFPKFNASFDARTQEIIYKKYINVGVAVDTDRGLLVPVLKNADRKNIAEIAVELGDLAARARSKKITADELQGANINLSNLGGLGTTYFSPIVAWPQVAIVGVGRAAHEAVYQEGGFVPRLILPLSVSYDHRLIDGADAARFLRWVAEALEQPLLIALEG